MDMVTVIHGMWIIMNDICLVEWSKYVIRGIGIVRYLLKSFARMSFNKKNWELKSKEKFFKKLSCPAP